MAAEQHSAFVVGAKDHYHIAISAADLPACSVKIHAVSKFLHASHLSAKHLPVLFKAYPHQLFFMSHHHHAVHDVYGIVDFVKFFHRGGQIYRRYQAAGFKMKEVNTLPAGANEKILLGQILHIFDGSSLIFLADLQLLIRDKALIGKIASCKILHHVDLFLLCRLIQHA